MSSPKVATTSPSQSPPLARVVGRQVDGVEVEHQVGDDRAGAGAGDLRRDVGEQLAGGQAAEDAVGEGDDRVEVGAGHRPEREDQRDEAAGGRGGVLEQLQPDVVGREALGEDARADDDRDEQRGADGLGGDLPAEGRCHRSAARPAPVAGGRRGVGELGDRAAERRRGLGAEPVVGPVPVALGLHEPGIAQHLAGGGSPTAARRRALRRGGRRTAPRRRAARTIRHRIGSASAFSTRRAATSTSITHRHRCR